MPVGNSGAWIGWLGPGRPFRVPRRRPTLRAATGFIALALALTACAPAAPGAPAGEAAPQPRAPKRILAALQGDPLTLYENINHAGGGSAPGVDALEQMLNVGLVALDGGGLVQPKLAEAVPSLENGLWQLFPDGRMQTTWRIREGARWHDGAPFTADDVLFTARVEQDRELAFRRSPTYELFESLQAPDPRTVVATWKRPYIWADRTFSSPFMPKHLLERPYLDNKAALLQLPFWTEELVGTGPYRLREFSRGIRAVITAEPTYPLGRPRIDEIEVRFIPDANTMVANILAGEIDVVLQGSGRGLSLEQALQVRDQWKDGKLDIRFSSWFVVYPQFVNPNPPVVADVQFRRALLHAIDRQELVDSLQGGMTSIAHSFLSPDLPEYRDVEQSIVRDSYDPRRASQLLESLGYARDADGALRDSAGQRLLLETRSTSSDLYQKTLFSVSDYWRRVGIGVEPVVVPPQRANDREYRANFPALDVTGQPNKLSDLAQYFHSSEARTLETNYTGENRARYRSPELDGLLERFTVTIPRQDRALVLGQALNHMTTQLNVMGLYYTVGPTLGSNRLLNAGAPGEGGTQTWNVHEWDLR